MVEWITYSHSLRVFFFHQHLKISSMCRDVHRFERNLVFFSECKAYLAITTIHDDSRISITHPCVICSCLLLIPPSSTPPVPGKQ